MKKIDSLNKKILKPRKQTIDFLLSFSKSIDVIQIREKNYLISKN